MQLDIKSKATEQKRANDLKMRQYERAIRKAKEKQVLAVTPQERKHWQQKSKALFSEYGAFAKNNGLVRNDWRCSITHSERAYKELLKTNGGNDLTEIAEVAKIFTGAPNDDIMAKNLVLIKSLC